jgi:hypothetical protein
VEKKTYRLFKRPRKKSGFIFQARFFDNEGKELPTKYSTGTNDFETAKKWAEQNHKTCLENYQGRAEMITFEDYFMEGSKYLELEKMDGAGAFADCCKATPSVYEKPHCKVFSGQEGSLPFADNPDTH